MKAEYATDKIGFPTLDAFATMAGRTMERVFAARAVRNVDVVIDESRDEDAASVLGVWLKPWWAPPYIKLYYWTWRTTYTQDASFDVARMLYIVLDHEVGHHLGYLSGNDPKHEEELAKDFRTANVALVARYGARMAALRYILATRLDELYGFARYCWPAFAIVVIYVATQVLFATPADPCLPPLLGGEQNAVYCGR